MSIEQRTRTEVIKALIGISDALALLLQERAAEEATPATSTLTLPVVTPEAPVAEKPKRKSKKDVITRSPEPERCTPGNRSAAS